jgi:hypothetical protein
MIESVTEFGGSYSVIGYTDTDWRTLRDDTHNQLINLGYKDSVSAKDAEISEDNDVIIGSYILSPAKPTGPQDIQTRAFTIGIEDGRTTFSFLKQ